MLENRDKLNLNLPILLVLVLFFSSQAFVKLLLILLEIKQIYILSIFCILFCKVNFFTAKCNRSGWIRCRPRCENLDRGQYRVQAIKFVNSVVNSPFETRLCWRFSRYSAPIHWLVHGHMTSNNDTVSPPNALSGQHCENYDLKRETVHFYPWNVDAVARDRWNLSAVFKFCFCSVLLYNKSLPRSSMFPSTSSWETKFTVPLGTSH